MKRWLLLALLVVGISAAATWMSMSMSASTASDSGGLPFPAADDEPKGPPPVAIVTGGDVEPTVHSFGMMAQETKGTHDFLIKNEGEGDLVLRGGHPSCSCTVLNLKDGEEIAIKPGESYPLKIEWETRMNSGKYEKQAAVYTNDPEHPDLTFFVRGEVEPAIIVFPSEETISLNSFPSDEVKQTGAALMSPTMPDFKITGLSSSNPELIHLDQRELSTDELLKMGKEGKKGRVVSIAIGPSKRLGTFLEEIVIKTDNPIRPEVRLTVAGNVLGPVSATPEAVRMSHASSTRGAETSVTIWSRGQAETAFTIAKQPEMLKVTIEPVDDKPQLDESGEVKGRAYRMTIAVPKGANTGIINEPIVLKTDHPEVGELKIPVLIQVTRD